MRKTLVLASILVLALAVPVSGLQMGDNLHFTVKNDTIKCVTITLPDDMGVVLQGKYEYNITLTPGPGETWADLSQESHNTDENNTVKTRICFYSFGKKESECGEPWNLRIEAPGMPTKTASGSVCVSDYADIDTNPLEAGQEPMESLNSNMDMFDIRFKKAVKYAEPGQLASFTLFVQSYADITLDVDVRDSLAVSPASRSLSLGRAEPSQSIEYTVSTGNPGEYRINATARVRGCDEQYCVKRTSARLIVQEDPPQEAGFMVALFPAGISVKALEPVLYQAIVTNNGPPAVFRMDLDLPPGVQSDSTLADLNMSSGGEETVYFTVTPQSHASTYEIGVRVSGPSALEKSATSYLATDEMLTDTYREAEQITGENPAAQESVDSALSDFYSDYSYTSYGDDLSSYSSLKDNLNAAKAQTAAPPTQPAEPEIIAPPTVPVAGLPQELSPAPEADMWWVWVLVPVIVLAAVLAFFFIRRKKPASEQVYEGV
jgi:hypothetical protein